MHNEEWQVFAYNGEPIIGKSAKRDDFNQDKSLIMGASHIWFWRCSPLNYIEVLLQRRSPDKMTWPGYVDVSVAGHVDNGETFVETAVRESFEEIGVSLTPGMLEYIFSQRAALDECEFDAVYICELDTEISFAFNDGEVESLEWVSLEKFKSMTESPDLYSLIPQGKEYFGFVINALSKKTSENN